MIYGDFAGFVGFCQGKTKPIYSFRVMRIAKSPKGYKLEIDLLLFPLALLALPVLEVFG